MQLRCKKCGGKELRFDAMAQASTTDGRWPRLWQIDSPENTLITCESCGNEGDWVDFYQPNFIFSAPDQPGALEGTP